MIGETIKKLRKKKGLNQEELAIKINSKQSYISQIEKNKKEPSIPFLKKICKILEVDIAVVFMMSLSREDVKKENKKLFDMLKPSIDEMILSLF